MSSKTEIHPTSSDFCHTIFGSTSEIFRGLSFHHQKIWYFGPVIWLLIKCALIYIISLFCCRREGNQGRRNKNKRCLDEDSSIEEYIGNIEACNIWPLEREPKYFAAKSRATQTQFQEVKVQNGSMSIFGFFCPAHSDTISFRCFSSTALERCPMSTTTDLFRDYSIQYNTI